MSETNNRLASRLIIDLNGYDAAFLKNCEKIFEIDSVLDGADSKLLMRWVTFAITDILELYTINPDTLYGTINIGPNIKKDYPEIYERFSVEQHEEFMLEYKTFATYAYTILGRRLELIISRGIDLGYPDIACHLDKYRPGMLLINVYGIGSFD